MKLLIVLVAATLTLAACRGDDRRQTAADEVFVLTAGVPGLSYRAGDAIDVTTTMEYVGPGAEVLVRGLPIGLVSLWFKQVDGPLEMIPESNMICDRKTTTLPRGRPVTVPPYRSVGFGLEDSHAAFYESWRADPDLRLPAGTWHVVAQAHICGGTGIVNDGDHLLRNAAARSDGKALRVPDLGSRDIRRR